MRLLATIVLLVAALPVAAQEWAPTVRTAPPAAPAPDVNLAGAEASVRSHLRDPDSARFGRAWVGRHGGACGYVNARNAFGGYTGEQPWVLAPGGRPLVARLRMLAGRVVADGGPDEDAFVAAWNKHCAGTR